MNLVKFVPSRDTPLEIIVPANLCCELLDSNGGRWCEVFVPPHSIMNVHKPWSTIVVEPEHVFFIPNESYNMFWINAGAKLNLYYKTDYADYKQSGLTMMAFVKSLQRKV